METLNHGILRFNDECTLKIDFDQETDDMTVTRLNDVTGEETVITGGGEIVQYSTGTFTGTDSTSLAIPFGFIPDVIWIYQSDETTLLKRIVEVFTINGIGASGLYTSNDTATSATKASLQSHPDITSSTNTIYIYNVTESGCSARIATSQCASGVQYTWKAWKFM